MEGELSLMRNKLHDLDACGSGFRIFFVPLKNDVPSAAGVQHVDAGVFRCDGIEFGNILLCER